MKRLTILLILASMLALGCSNASIKTDFAAGQDFTAFRSYSWVVLPSGTQYDATGDLHEHIKRTIDNQLKEEGLAMVDENPDLLVIYHGTKAGKLKHTASQQRYPTEDTMAYDQGTLIVDLVDAETGNVVWRGTAEGILPENSSFEDKTKFIEKGVKDMFKEYPPK